MSRSGKLSFGLLSAATFYGVFGFVMPKYFAQDAASSIAPAIQVIVTIITVGAIAFFMWRLFQADAEWAAASGRKATVAQFRLEFLLLTRSGHRHLRIQLTIPNI